MKFFSHRFHIKCIVVRFLQIQRTHALISHIHQTDPLGSGMKPLIRANHNPAEKPAILYLIIIFDIHKMPVLVRDIGED